MSFLRLALCIAGVYSMFLLWAIAQERLSVPFRSVDGRTSDKFKSALFMGTCQSALSSLSALIYILFRRNPTHTIAQSLGLDPLIKHNTAAANGTAKTGTVASNGSVPHQESNSTERKALVLRYLQCSVFITAAAPFGFAALSYISYPAMVLGKSCKLVPVMLMNVLLYRRKFAPHKYLVVGTVTLGITIFMGLGPQKHSSSSSTKASPSTTNDYANLIGMVYLLINLALDGATNSTQDEIFTAHKHVTGQQMMLFINLFCTALTLAIGCLPLPYVPVLHPSNDGRSELAGALAFISGHEGVAAALGAFALTGALGQLFIFETLQHFGSLTLVTITLTRKLFTMLLSVIIYAHPLTGGQWLGAAIVFAGISIEAAVKIRGKNSDVHPKKIAREEEMARIKTL